MDQIEKLIARIDGGELDSQFELLYGKNAENLKFQKARYKGAIAGYAAEFGKPEEELSLFSVPGRTEIGGNHTDHNHGKVLAAAVDLDIIAVVGKTADKVVRVKSEGFDIDIVELDDLAPKKKELYKSCSLVRGTCAKLAELGYKLGGGFNAFTTSRVLKGSGLSSSAAFEVMVGNIISHFYNDGKIDPVAIAQVAQYAESVYFGKPCGLMDQTACSVGGFITIDFDNPEKPVIQKLDFDFAATGYSLCIVDTAGNHSDLNEDYASIQDEMKKVARLMGKTVLRECDEAEFFQNIKTLRAKAGDRAVLRAIHFYGDNARVDKQAQALRAGDFETFRKLVIESGRSSFMYLQNSYSIKQPAEQGIPLALALAEKLLEGSGAWRVHGGGFAGTIQAFVPKDKIDLFVSTFRNIFGEKACYILSIRNPGGYRFH